MGGLTISPMPGKLVETNQIIVPTGETLRLEHQGLTIKGTTKGIEVRGKTTSAMGTHDFKFVLDVGNQAYPEGLVVRLTDNGVNQHIIPVADERNFLRRLLDF